MTTVEIASLIAAYALALARILNAGRFAWAWAPVPVQLALPALLIALPQLATALGAAETKLDITEAAILAVGSVVAATRGKPPELAIPKAPSVPKLPLLMFMLALLGVTGCGTFGASPIKTVDDIAHEACASFFARERGLSFEAAAQGFCATEEQLRPFLQQLKAAERSARARAFPAERQ